MAKARWLAEILVTNIMKTSRVFNRSICTDYDTIVKKITAQSETTEQLVTQEAYVEYLQTGEIYTLRVRRGNMHAKGKAGKYTHSG